MKAVQPTAAKAINGVIAKWQSQPSAFNGGFENGWQWQHVMAKIVMKIFM